MFKLCKKLPMCKGTQKNKIKKQTNGRYKNEGDLGIRRMKTKERKKKNKRTL